VSTSLSPVEYLQTEKIPFSFSPTEYSQTERIHLPFFPGKVPKQRNTFSSLYHVPQLRLSLIRNNALINFFLSSSFLDRTLSVIHKAEYTTKFSKICLVIVITLLIIGNIFKTHFEICFRHLFDVHKTEYSTKFSKIYLVIVITLVIIGNIFGIHYQELSQG